MTVDMNDIISIVDTDITDIEKNISTDIGQLLIYRLCLKYGNDLDIKIRGTFEMFCDKLSNSNCFKDIIDGQSTNIGLKQLLYNFGIYFTENYLDGLDSNMSKSRMLLILEKWENYHVFKDKCEEYKNKITDLFITSMHDNSEYDRVFDILNKSSNKKIGIWYTRNNYNMYASSEERDKAYSDKFGDDEILDITSELYSIIDVNNIKSSSFIDLISYGKRIDESGVRCVRFNGFVDGAGYRNIYIAFLVYLAEEYGIMINTDADSEFCSLYSEYKSGCYCLAEELFTLMNSIEPIMYYVDNINRRLLYIRDIICEYEYKYVNLSELELMIIGDRSVRMHQWRFCSNVKYKDSGYVNPKDVKQSNFLKRYCNGGVGFCDELGEVSNIEIIPIFEQFSSDIKIAEIVNTFNSYNIRSSGGVVRKCITVRDLLCRKVNNGIDDEIQIGFVYSSSIDDFNFRIRFGAIVSGIIDSEDSDISDVSMDIIRPTFFKFNKNDVDKMFSLRYIFDISDEMSDNMRRLTDYLEKEIDEHSYQDDYEDGDYVSEEYEDESDEFCSVPEKFLYYCMTKQLQSMNKNSDILLIPDSKRELRASKYGAVYTASEIIPELVNRFGGIENIVESGVIDIYGNITDKFIGHQSNGSAYFNIRNELFGVMK